MRYRTIAFLSCLMCCFPAVAQGDEEKEKLGAPLPVIAGSLHRGYVYALSRDRDGHVFCFLQRGKLTLAGKEPGIQELPVRHSDWAQIFHIHDDTSFTTDGIVWGESGLEATRVSNLTQKRPREYFEKWTGMRIYPASQLAWKHARSVGINPDFSATKEASFSFAIDPDGKLFVFLAWKKRLRIWSGNLPTIKKEAPKNPAQIKWDNWKGDEETAPNPKPVRVVETDINDQYFFAYQDKAHWYFVTDTGRVLRLPRDDKAKRTECIWEDLRRPVRLVLEDNATGKTWAFAPRKDNRGKKVPDVYFPLAKKIEPVEYDSSKLPAWDLGKPLDMALTHARFLVKEKKVSVEDKKPKPAQKK